MAAETAQDNALSQSRFLKVKHQNDKFHFVIQQMSSAARQTGDFEPTYARESEPEPKMQRPYGRALEKVVPRLR